MKPMPDVPQNPHPLPAVLSAGFAMTLVFGMVAGCLFLLIFFLKDRFGKRR